MTWLTTPQGKAALTWVLFALLAVWLCALVLRTAHRDRLARDEEELVEIGEWETALDIPVRAISRHEMNREADRLQAECYADALPEQAAVVAVGVARPWPLPLSPRLHEVALMLPDPQPLPVRWDPLVLPAYTYASQAATFAHDMRDGVEVYDVDAYAEGVIRRLHSTVDAPVSPAFGYRPPRHDYGALHRGEIEGCAVQKKRWEQDTGAWQVVRPRELTGASA